MAEILEHQLLDISNLYTFRGKIKTSSIESIKKDMYNTIVVCGAKILSNFIVATYGVYGQERDIEILVAIDRVIPDIEKFRYKERILIVNAIVARHRGTREELQDTLLELGNYIAERDLLPTTVAYHIANEEGTEVDVYMGISPNIV